MTQELALIEDIKEENYPVIYGRSLDHFYEKVRAEVSSEVPDLTTAKGRARIASLAANVSKSKVAVEKPGREYLKQLKDLPKKIEAELRDFTDKMDKLRDETRKPLTDWENAEKARVESHKSKIAELVSYRDGVISDSQFALSLIGQIESVVIDSSFEEFEAEAHREKAESIAFLKAARERLIKHEAEQAELARLRAEAEERARKDREEQIAREAAEKAKREAEEAAAREKAAAERRELELKLAAEQAERQRIAAEQAAKDADAARIKAEQEAAERAVKAAQEAEERVKREAEAKAAREAAEPVREKDKAHRARINNEAAASFIEAGFTEEQARKIVVLVASGKVKNIRISY